MKTTRAKQPAAPPRRRPGMPSALPAEVRRPLRALMRRGTRVAWTGGALRLVVAVCALAATQGAADWLFDLPRRVRAGFLVLDLAVLVYLIIRHGVTPWRRRLSPDDAARLAERHWPEFRSALISAVQLAREPGGSPPMVAALQRQVAAHVGRVDLRQALAWRRLRGWFVAAAGLAVGVGAFAWWTGPVGIVLARRAALQNVPLPTRTVVVDVSQNLSVAPGDGVELSARAQGEIPRHGRLEIAYPGKPVENLAVTPKPASPDTFTLTLPNVQGPFAYRFYLGDGRGAEWEVKLLRPPALRAVEFRAVYPPYAGLREAVLAPGNLRLLAGSRLQIAGRADGSLRSARLVPQGGGAPQELRTEADRAAFKGELSIPAAGLTGFTVALTDDAGVASRNDTLYAVEIVPDRPPEIVLAPDQAEKANLVATERPALRFEVRDDFQVKEVVLLVEPADALAEGEAPDPAKAKRVLVEIKKPAAALTFDYRWTDPEKTVKWQEGNTFYYWIEARDNNDVTGPGVTRTSAREWSVVSLKTKREELTSSLRKSADSIDNLFRSQEDLRARVGDLLRQEPAKP